MAWRCKIKQKAYHKSYGIAYYKANKEKVLLQQSTYYEANKEKVLLQQRAYKKANKEKVRLQKKAYYQANKEKISLRNKAYYQANKPAYNARKKYRKTLKIKQVPVKVRNCPKEKKRLQQIYKLCDVITKATGVKHHVDHMWPLSKGGPHWSGNLQIITASANLEKGTKLDRGIKKTIQEMLRDIKDVY